jgi:glycosyltransferase involved in cell wall biosynthesis
VRILHVDTGREMRGGQWQVLRLHQSLIEAGHESFLLARGNGDLLKAARERGLPAGVLRAVVLGFISRRFDLIHAHDAASHTCGALFSRTPLVVSRRVAFPVKKSQASRWKYSRARRYLAVSRFVAGILASAGIDSGRIDIVYDGVQVPADAARGEAIVTPYTTDPAKAMALAEQAAAIAGLPLIRSRNLEHDLPGARAMVYLTQSEGLGSGILLAMAYGVAVIASRTGGIPELIDDGLTGILVQNEKQSVADALRRLNPDLCLTFGLAAREAVIKRFTVTHMLAATLDSYRKALHD